MKPKHASNFIPDMVTELEEEKLAGSYIVNYVKATKNWLEFNDKKITRKIKVSKSDEYEKYAKEKPPTPDELRKILHMADFRTRVAISLIAFSGVRLEVIGNYLGDDGLKIMDFPELTIKDKKVEFQTTPTLLLLLHVLPRP